MSAERIARLKHELLLVSLLILLFGQLIVPPAYQDTAQPFLFGQTIFAGIFLFYEKPRWRNTFVLIFLVIVVIEIFNYIFDTTYLMTWRGSIYIFFFLSVSVETYRQIFTTKEVGVSMVVAVFSGFILLCFIASLIFMIIELQNANSFSNLGEASERYQNLNYFSFITTLTIGYGDIVPLTMQAKKAVMLISLLGNFYSVFVTGTVIGKYINSRRK